jgi:hypothetical protein
MVAVPAVLAVTVPLVTVATLVLSDVQLTALFVALFGATVAVRVAVPPSTRVRVAGSRVTPVTATGFVLESSLGSSAVGGGAGSYQYRHCQGRYGQGEKARESAGQSRISAIRSHTNLQYQTV